jgi:hypothetical protein
MDGWFVSVEFEQIFKMRLHHLPWADEDDAVRTGSLWAVFLVQYVVKLTSGDIKQ